MVNVPNTFPYSNGSDAITIRKSSVINLINKIVSAADSYRSGNFYRSGEIVRLIKLVRPPWGFNQSSHRSLIIELIIEITNLDWCSPRTKG